MPNTHMWIVRPDGSDRQRLTQEETRQEYAAWRPVRQAFYVPRDFDQLHMKPERDYSGKLQSFEEFAAPELRRIIDDLALEQNATILDLGCGAGFITRLLTSRASSVVGLDLASAHARKAAVAASRASIVVADGSILPFRSAAFDVVWSSNTVNHFADPVAALREVGRILSPNGRLVLGQSSLLPEMFFSWDYHWDARVRAACHAYYRQKHGLAEADTARSTRLLGVVRDAGFEVVRARTHVIERISPLTTSDRDYFLQVFQNYWGPRIRPFLNETDWRALELACSPQSTSLCVDRPDFHHIQTYTVIEGRRG